MRNKDHTWIVVVLLAAVALIMLTANEYRRGLAHHYDYEWQRVCGSLPFSGLQDGMTASEVRDLLGEPTQINPVQDTANETPARPRLVESWTYKYPEGGLTLIYFGQDGRVVTHSCGPV